MILNSVWTDEKYIKKNYPTLCNSDNFFINSIYQQAIFTSAFLRSNDKPINLFYQNKMTFVRKAELCQL